VKGQPSPKLLAHAMRNLRHPNMRSHVRRRDGAPNP
jgi:hypothetical protein